MDSNPAANANGATARRDATGGAALFWVNALTLSRIPGVFGFMLCALIRAHGGPVGWAWAALTLLVLSALTDLFDGWLARRWRVVTAFGAHADPLADKAIYLVVLPTFVYLITQDRQTAHAPVPG